MQNMETLNLRATPVVATQPQGRESGGSIEKTEEAKAGA
jgi:hypothetical protein